MSRSFRTLLPVVPVCVAVLLSLTSAHRSATAEPAAVDQQEKKEKCATRLSIVMVGESASTDLLAAPDPQAQFDTLAKDPRFVERFSRFINSEFNRNPGMTPAEDASYYMAKFNLENAKPWADMFTGQYDVAPTDPTKANSEAAVTADPNGLGYFRSKAWAIRYAGNELAGIRIVTAYRMMQNTLGLKLQATTNAPDADVSVTGRSNAPCNGCHFNNWFALDKTAAVLGTRTGTGNNTQFQPSKLGPQTILGGVTVSDDKGLVEALVADPSFNVNACRLAYKYLYGRNEYSCDGPVFDKCVDAFAASKMITTALATVAKDATFCE